MTTDKLIVAMAFLGLPILSGAATVNFSGVNVNDQSVTGTASDFVFRDSPPNQGTGGFTTNLNSANTATNSAIFDNSNNTGLQGEPRPNGKQTWDITVKPGEFLNLSFSAIVSNFYQAGSYTSGPGNFSVTGSGNSVVGGGSPLAAGLQSISAPYDNPNPGSADKSQLFTATYTWSNILAGTYSFNVAGSAIENYTVRTDVVDTDFVAAVPVPGAIWLMGSGLVGLISLSKRKKR